KKIIEEIKKEGYVRIRVDGEIYDINYEIEIEKNKKHSIEITSQTIEQMVDRVLEHPEKTRIKIMAPIVYGKKGTHKKIIEEIKKEGYVRIRVDGEIYDIN
ncbi:hypothetical protein, partial [Listeria monocytogenes]|uniref:hypothetical protein n=1 Tax=Listeria monocytogenes TaxID=1639 RepID=UPI000A90A31B